jgi:hypothetical protein
MCIPLIGGSEIICGRLENFEAAVFYEDTESRRVKAARLDKGQGGQLNGFIERCGRRAPMPIPLQHLFDTTLTTLGVAEALGNSGCSAIDELGRAWSALSPTSRRCRFRDGFSRQAVRPPSAVRRGRTRR